MNAGENSFCQKSHDKKDQPLKEMYVMETRYAAWQKPNNDCCIDPLVGQAEAKLQVLVVYRKFRQLKGSKSLSRSRYSFLANLFRKEIKRDSKIHQNLCDVLERLKCEREEYPLKDLSSFSVPPATKSIIKSDLYLWVLYSRKRRRRRRNSLLIFIISQKEKTSFSSSSYPSRVSHSPIH